MMPYLAAVFGLSSTLSLTILTLSPSAVEISSSAGAIMRQGPHHSAQKSTTTGPLALRTSVSKVASDTFSTAMEHLLQAPFCESWGGKALACERMDGTGGGQARVTRV